MKKTLFIITAVLLLSLAGGIVYFANYKTSPSTTVDGTNVNSPDNFKFQVDKELNELDKTMNSVIPNDFNDPSL